MNKAEIALTKMLMSTDPATVADACAVKCLQLVETREVPAAATDGVVLLVNPDFLEGLSIDQICGLLVHEVCHVRFGHNARFADSGWLDHDRANKSMDREINPLVVRAGYQLPPNGCWPRDIGCYDGLSWEEYYQHEAGSDEQAQDEQAQDKPESTQSDDKQQGGSKDGEQGESSPDGQPDGQDGDQPGDELGSQDGPVADGVHAPGSLTERFAPQVLGRDEDPAELAEEVAEALEDAAEQGKVKPTKTQRHKAGTGTQSQELRAELIVATDCRWQDAVIGLVATRASGESIADWSRPSRRSIAQGSYRPARRKVSGYRLALVLDVSGSCIGYFSEWQSMARELVEAVPEITEIDIYYHDDQVTGTDSWVRRTGDEVTIQAQGGGGTDFRPVLAEVERADVDGVILFTDSEGPWPTSCSIDCVTVQPPGSYRQSPIGTTVRINEWQ
jgi:predicted metal-dependent peptidase